MKILHWFVSLLIMALLTGSALMIVGLCSKNDALLKYSMIILVCALCVTIGMFIGMFIGESKD